MFRNLAFALLISIVMIGCDRNWTPPPSEISENIEMSGEVLEKDKMIGIDYVVVKLSDTRNITILDAHADIIKQLSNEYNVNYIAGNYLTAVEVGDNYSFNFIHFWILLRNNQAKEVGIIISEPTQK